MKEKRKKIVARVGAMVAAVLLVALCALPAFAVVVPNPEQEIVYLYDIQEGTPLYEALVGNYVSLVNINRTPNLYQFVLPQVGETVRDERLTIEALWPTKYGTLIVKNNGGFMYRLGNNDTYCKTSFTTSGQNRFVYAKFYAVGYAGAPDIEILNIRIKYDKDTLIVNDTQVITELDGTKSGAGYVFAFLTNDDGTLPIDYLLFNGLLSYGNVGVKLNYHNFEQGWGNAYNEAWSGGFENGYNDGYENGHYYGYDEGWKEGSSLAKEEYSNGYDKGYQIGKNEGYDEGMSQSSLVDGVTAIFRAPMELINSVLNFEILGINMAVAVRVLISMAILGVVITFIWKAVK